MPYKSSIPLQSGTYGKNSRKLLKVQIWVVLEGLHVKKAMLFKQQALKLLTEVVRSRVAIFGRSIPYQSPPECIRRPELCGG